jgi:hypothetical protein
MKKLKYFISLSLILALFTACEEDTYEFGDITTPTNLVIAFDVVGLDAENPYGDGSGFVTFTATADNALSYEFKFGDGVSTTATAGVSTHRYTQVGINSYTVVVIAFGTAGVMTSTAFELDVLNSYQDLELEAFLAGTNDGDSKTWVWASDIDRFVGLGPANVSDTSDNPDWVFYDAWWNQIQANDTDKACMYTNEFVFTKTSNGLTFEQTQGPAWIPGTYAEVIGVSPDQCYDEAIATTMFGLKSVSLFPAASYAAINGTYNELPYRQTSFKISDGGFMGWYVGDVEYDIISVTENSLFVRCVQPDSEFAWYAKYKVQ